MNNEVNDNTLARTMASMKRTRRITLLVTTGVLSLLAVAIYDIMQLHSNLGAIWTTVLVVLSLILARVALVCVKGSVALIYATSSSQIEESAQRIIARKAERQASKV